MHVHVEQDIYAISTEYTQSPTVGDLQRLCDFRIETPLANIHEMQLQHEYGLLFKRCQIESATATSCNRTANTWTCTGVKCLSPRLS